MRRFAGNRTFTTGANIQVTRVQVYLRPYDDLKAHVDITLDDCFVVMEVIRRDHGYSVAMPRRKWRKGGHYTIAYASTAEARLMIEEAVMAEYWKVVAEAAQRPLENTI